jgi:hypothetical protein
VDIQPVALQITKLRFFIALIIDQKIDWQKRDENFNIRALPNLETKFVAANTLISLPQRGSTLFDTKELQAHKEQLFDKRRQHIAPKNRREKKQLEEDDKKLRALIKDELLDLRFDEDGARLIAEYNPYDQNATAPFFDPEWMFGPDVKDGFDIVIGNPPYVRADGQDLILRSEIMAQERYETLWEKWDLYVPFIELGYKVLRPGGVTTLIVADAFCHAKYAIKPQKWYLENAVVRRLDFLRDIKIFEASVSNVVYFFQKPTKDIKPANNIPERRLHVESFGHIMSLPSKLQSELDHRAFFPEDGEATVFNKETVLLEKICYISVGMVANSHEVLAPGEFGLDDLLSPIKDKTHPKAFVEAKDLSRWILRRHKYIEWGTKRSPALLRRKTFEELYEQDEKLMLTMVGEPRAALDINRYYCNHGIFVCIRWIQLRGVINTSIKKSAKYSNDKGASAPFREDLENLSKTFSNAYLIGVINSATARDFLRANRRNNVQFYPDDWKKLPIPTATPGEQAAIASKVEQVLAAKAHDPAAEVSTLEREIDELVADLYGLDAAEKQLVGIE